MNRQDCLILLNELSYNPIIAGAISVLISFLCSWWYNRFYHCIKIQIEAHYVFERMEKGRPIFENDNKRCIIKIVNTGTKDVYIDNISFLDKHPDLNHDIWLFNEKENALIKPGNHEIYDIFEPRNEPPSKKVIVKTRVGKIFKTKIKPLPDLEPLYPLPKSLS